MSKPTGLDLCVHDCLWACTACRGGRIFMSTHEPACAWIWGFSYNEMVALTLADMLLGVHRPVPYSPFRGRVLAVLRPLSYYDYGFLCNVTGSLDSGGE